MAVDMLPPNATRERISKQREQVYMNVGAKMIADDITIQGPKQLAMLFAGCLSDVCWETGTGSFGIANAR